jgi:hypothetical protein
LERHELYRDFGVTNRLELLGYVVDARERAG